MRANETQRLRLLIRPTACRQVSNCFVNLYWTLTGTPVFYIIDIRGVSRLFTAFTTLAMANYMYVLGVY